MKEHFETQHCIAGVGKLRVVIWLIAVLMTTLSPNAFSAEVDGRVGEMRFNQIQYIGTHNSYHVAPMQALGMLMVATDYEESPEWPAERLIHALDYTHVPITTQLELGMRQFELDVHYDPAGSKFSNPGGLRLLQATEWPVWISFDPQEDLKRPGFKVFHAADTDVGSTCFVLVDCLSEIKDWSDANPYHFPIIIQIEAKERSKKPIAEGYEPVEEVEFDREVWNELEAELLSVFARHRIVTPDDVRGSRRTLRQAILKDGWPKLSDMAGKVVFTLLDKKGPTNRYVGQQENLQRRLLFVSVKPDHPAASWMRVTDTYYEKIPTWVDRGFMVLTRADAHSVEARENDVNKRNKALEVGAHFILTDYAIPDRRFSNYHVRFDSGKFVRCNPVTWDKECPF